MSRFRRALHSLASGYLLLGATILSVFASVPLALHYLSKNEFGLWALVTQVSGYLLLIDLGMSGSISRILIDHKDDPAGGIYGAIIKTGVLVLGVQGIIIALAGALASIWLPDLFLVPAIYRREFQILIALQCIITGTFLFARISTHLLQAHQRYDIMNYSQILGLVVNFAVMWLGFCRGWGLYSILVASAAANLFGTVTLSWAVMRLKLLPPAGSWGRANWKTFHDLFSYGREIFLLTVGWQLVNASQVMVISRTLGLDAAAVWSIATKPFMMAQQVVNNLFNFSFSALAEMMVRKERDRLLTRFRDLLVISASLSMFAGMAVGLCNQSFMALWTKGLVSWNSSNDWLMSLLVIVYSISRCYIGLIGTTKDIRALKYVYPLEGALFVGLSVMAAPRWGIAGIIVCAISTNFLLSGLYGFSRTREYFQIKETKEMLAWLKGPVLCLVVLALVFLPLQWVGRNWGAATSMCINVLVVVPAGLGTIWWIGLTPQLRSEAAGFLKQVRNRLGF